MKYGCASVVIAGGYFFAYESEKTIDIIVGTTVGMAGFIGVILEVYEAKKENSRLENIEDKLPSSSERKLTEEQRVSLIAELRENQIIQGVSTVQINFWSGNAECHNFAQQIWDVFNECGWGLVPMQGLGGSAGHGINVFSTSQPSDAAAEIVCNAFANAGIKVEPHGCEIPKGRAFIRTQPPRVIIDIYSPKPHRQQQEPKGSPN